jgi:hypothetical protein
MKGKTFTWNDRLTLIDHYKPTDEQACTVFGVQQAELDVARNHLKTGVFSLSQNLDVDSYDNLFASASGGTDSVTSTITKAPTRTKPTVTTVTTTKSAPETATAKVREKAKRGRKGDKIISAFASIPTTPTPAEDFAKQYGVSIAVLRQSKRFDKTEGTVKVKKDKASKTLMIWRESV